MMDKEKLQRLRELANRDHHDLNNKEYAEFIKSKGDTRYTRYASISTLLRATYSASLDRMGVNVVARKLNERL